MNEEIYFDYDLLERDNLEFLKEQILIIETFNLMFKDKDFIKKIEIYKRDYEENIIETYGDMNGNFIYVFRVFLNVDDVYEVCFFMVFEPDEYEYIDDDIGEEILISEDFNELINKYLGTDYVIKARL